jgi:hypothetical protein
MFGAEIRNERGSHFVSSFMQFKKALEDKERPDRVDNTPDPLWKLIQDCWDPEPAARPLASVVVRRLE